MVEAQREKREITDQLPKEPLTFYNLDNSNITTEQVYKKEAIKRLHFVRNHNYVSGHKITR